jgi:hypothetical protein
MKKAARMWRSFFGNDRKHWNDEIATMGTGSEGGKGIEES